MHYCEDAAWSCTACSSAPRRQCAGPPAYSLAVVRICGAKGDGKAPRPQGGDRVPQAVWTGRCLVSGTQESIALADWMCCAETESTPGFGCHPQPLKMYRNIGSTTSCSLVRVAFFQARQGLSPLSASTAAAYSLHDNMYITQCTEQSATHHLQPGLPRSVLMTISFPAASCQAYHQSDGLPKHVPGYCPVHCTTQGVHPSHGS